MKVLMINSVCGIRSTGRICTDLAEELEKQGHEVKIAYGREAYVPEQYQKYAVRIGNDWDVRFHALYARMFDASGFGSKRATRKFIEWAENYNPDLLWLHNIHGYYINIELLFNWIKKHPEMEVKWTLHDCWAFTGHCTYFSYVKCYQWKKICESCDQLREYPSCITCGNVKTNFLRKKNAFLNINNITIITPSKWLAELVKDSFLKEYPIRVKYNTINYNIYKPTQSDFKEKYEIIEKIMILGVASVWEKRKGLEDFYKLAEMLDDKYVIVLVGLNKKQIKNLPRNIKGFKRMNSPNRLAEVYTAADIFLNLSKEETFGMSSLETEACGTETIVYEDTVCEEIARINGSVVVPQDIRAVYQAITGKPYGGGTKGANKIICFQRIDSIEQIVSIYSASDFFVNTTYEDNYPTVNLEAIACGTKVITYNTGGAKETVVNSIDLNSHY